MALTSMIETTPSSVKAGSTSEYDKTLAGFGTPNPAVDLNSEYDALMGQSASVSAQMMSGLVPEDVQRQTRMMTAQKSASMGLGVGSQASRNLVARDLGLTSLSLMQAGQASALQIGALQEDKRKTSLAFLTDQRKLDLEYAGLAEDSRKSNLAAQLQLQEMLLRSVSGSAELQVKAFDVGMEDEAMAGLANDFMALNTSIREALGLETTPAEPDWEAAPETAV